MKKNIAAFFDVDGTIYRDSLLIEIFKKLVKFGIIDEKYWVNDVKPKFLNWDNRHGTYDDYLLKLVEIYRYNISGFDKSIIEHIAEQIVSEKGERVYTYARDRIEWHKKQGHKVIAISGSPSLLVKPFVEMYGLDDFAATVYKYDTDNKFTNEVIPMWDNKSKQQVLKSFVEKYNIDVASSYAYGDTTGDISMFNLTGNPTAINPNHELLDLIKNTSELKGKINIVVERKNVVYNIPIEDL